MSNTTPPAHPGLTRLLGIFLLILGILALSSQVFTAVASVYFFGWMLIISGAIQFIYGIFSGEWSAFFLSLLAGGLSFLFGALLVANPAFSAASVTFLVGILMLITGTYQIFASLLSRNEHWGWGLAAGIIALLLGVAVFAGWPYSGLRLIGLVIGIELFITGFVLTATAYQPTEIAQTMYTPTSGSLSGIKGGGVKKQKS